LENLTAPQKTLFEKLPYAKELGVIHGHFTDHSLNGRTLQVAGNELFHFANCSYLGLELDHRLKAAATDAIERYGVTFACSRTYLESNLYPILEGKFEQIFEKPCLVAGSTSLGHISSIPNIVQKNDAIILDQQVHHSVQNATLMAKATGIHVEIVRHNRMDILENKIIELSKKHRKIWYMADGVYSMFGDIAPMPTLYEMLNKYEQFHIYIDDAHGMSWAGKHGRGFALSQVGYFHPKMCFITSLGKGFGTGGGVMVFGTELERSFIKNVGSTLIFSGPIPMSMLAASIASADIHLSDEIHLKQTQLQDRMRFFVEKSNELDLPIVRQDHSPICFIGTGPTYTDSLEVGHLLQKDGFFVNVSSYPVVPLKQSGLRITLNITHSHELIEQLLLSIAKRLAQKNINKTTVMKAFDKLA
jgi:7-keto-8-aminopelargonate synthetase-like enzyme